MIRRLVRRNNSNRIRFCLRKTNCCPECSSKMFWNENNEVFQCLNNNCNYIEALKDTKIEDNKKELNISVNF